MLKESMLSLRGKYRSAYSKKLVAKEGGFISAIDAYKIGLAGVYLGVGRDKTSDPVYPDVGFIFEKKVGAAVAKGATVATVYGKDEASLEAAWPLVESALAVAREKRAPAPIVLEEISAL